MKNASIFHGTGGNPTLFWTPYLKKHLQELGYTVWTPQLPDTDKPELKNWLPYALDNGMYDTESVLIGHSAGCPLMLSILENIEVKIKLAIFVSGFVENLTSGKTDPILQETYDWEKIKSHCEHFIFINSDNDPWKCDDKQGRIMFDNLGGELLIRHGEGHMGSVKFNQPYTEFPLLVKLIETFEI